jgi:asparagine synthetase B (glutamine-hydrolysing)
MPNHLASFDALMCGIVVALKHMGFDLGHVVSEMVGAIYYRGLDDSGVWCEPSIGLGHAQLSTLNLFPIREK